MSRFCVVEGTKITLNDKETIPIEQIKVGQEILSFNLNTLQKSQKYDILVKMETNNFEGFFQEDLVKNVWKNTVDEYYLINDKLKITKDHIVLSKRNNMYYWTKVEQLLLNDYLFTELNIFEKITSIIIVKEPVKVFNLEVNRVFNYFANSYLIHNGAPCSACGDACGVAGFTSFTLTLTDEHFGISAPSINVTINDIASNESPSLNLTSLPDSCVFAGDLELNTEYVIRMMVTGGAMDSTLADAGAGGHIIFSNTDDTVILNFDPGPNWDGKNDGSATITFKSAVSTASFMLET